MNSSIMLTLSALACLLPILAVEGQLHAAWRVSKEGSTDTQGFISTNGLVPNLPSSLLRMFSGNHTAGNLFGLFTGGGMDAGNSFAPTQDSGTQQTGNISEGDIAETETDASRMNPFTWWTPDTTPVITTTEPITTTTPVITTTEPITTTTPVITTTEPITTTTPVITTTEPITTTTPVITTTETTTETTPVMTTTETMTVMTTAQTTPTTSPDGRPVPSAVEVGPDGRNYFKSDRSLSQGSCQTYCHGFRGYRLAIAKTNETMEALRSHGNVMIDLSISRNPRTSDVKLIWGDGTELDSSLAMADQREPILNSGRSSSVMIMYRSGPNFLLDDAPARYALPCLCQEIMTSPEAY